MASLVRCIISSRMAVNCRRQNWTGVPLALDVLLMYLAQGESFYDKDSSQRRHTISRMRRVLTCRTSCRPKDTSNQSNGRQVVRRTKRRILAWSARGWAPSLDASHQLVKPGLSLLKSIRHLAVDAVEGAIVGRAFCVSLIAMCCQDEKHLFARVIITTTTTVSLQLCFAE